VRKGAAKPDISSADALKKTLLAVKIDRLFHRPERIYMLSVFEKLGIAREVSASSSRPRPACSSAP